MIPRLPSFLWFFVGLTISLVICLPYAHAGQYDSLHVENGTIYHTTPNGNKKLLYPGLQSSVSGGNLILSQSKDTFTMGNGAGARVPVTIDAIARRIVTPTNLAKAGLALLKKNPVLITGVAADIFSQLDLHYDPVTDSYVNGVALPAETIAATQTTPSPTPPQLCVTNTQYCGSTGQAAVNAYNAATFPAHSCCSWWENPRSWNGTTETVDTYNVTNGSKGSYRGTDQWGVTVANTCPAGSSLTGGQCVYAPQYSCPSGYSLSGSNCTKAAVVPTPITNQQALDQVLNADPALDPFYQGLNDTEPIVIDSDIPIQTDLEKNPTSDTTVTPTPAGYQIKSPTSTKDNQNGTRTEEKTTVDAVKSGDTITYNITNTSNVINNTTNQTVSTSTETNTGGGTGETPQDYSYVDTPLQAAPGLLPMPAVPDFYVQKYPNGFAGVWDQFKVDIDQSSFIGMIDSLTPTNWTGGECPSWEFSFNLGAAGNFGTHTLAPPCWIFPVLKVLLMITALFAARRIIFGG